MRAQNNIRELRERKRLTLQALADGLDISIATLNRMENGVIKQFKPDFLVRLSTVLECSIDHLFKDRIVKEEVSLSKEQLYRELLATKDKRIKDLVAQLKDKS